MLVQLREFCAARSGDKGDIADVSLFVDTDAHYGIVQQHVTVEAVARLFQSLGVGRIERFEVHNLRALKFVIHDALGGGAARSLRADNLGKTFGGTLLRLRIDVDESVLGSLPRLRPTGENKAQRPAHGRHRP